MILSFCVKRIEKSDQNKSAVYLLIESKMEKLLNHGKLSNRSSDHTGDKEGR